MSRNIRVLGLRAKVAAAICAPLPAVPADVYIRRIQQKRANRRRMVTTIICNTAFATGLLLMVGLLWRFQP